jgi:hypothetical protein
MDCPTIINWEFQYKHVNKHITINGKLQNFMEKIWFK